MPAVLFRWIFWGTGGILLTLILASIAPIFINSNNPGVGFLMWGVIICLWLGSLLYVMTILQRANRIRRLFIQHFPEENDRQIWNFVGLNFAEVIQRLEDWELLKTDPTFSALNLSPFEFIHFKK